MRNHKLIYSSSPDRGLDILLNMWPEIKAKFPDATLDVAYGWKVFDMMTVNNPERQEWKKKIIELLKQDGITDHGRIGKEELHKLRLQCGIWTYPTYFTEINCINALECQRDGVVPVTMAYAALKESVGAGVKVDGDIYDKETKEVYLKELLALMGDEKRWKAEQLKGIEFTKNYDWSTIAKTWTKQFEKRKEDIKVSIVTPTNRRGFWNIMADNIAKQTYKNVEWIIVDDYKDNRESIAKEYAKKYKLDIKYYRGKPHKVKRNYALVNANNTGMQMSSGELMVILQDFVLMPETGIEELVIVYRNNPTALIAPVDIYHAPKIKPDTEKEDWFNGELDVKGEFMRKNVRLLNKGVRESTHPFEFEQNYGAVPTEIVRNLGGWWEFFDFGLGFDNTAMAYRALKAGYKLIVDDTNIAVCIDHWNALEGTAEHGLKRERRLNDPQYIWMMEMMEQGKLPLVRDQKLDDKINLTYEMPEDVEKGKEVEWMRAHLEEIVTRWMEEVKL